MRAHKLPSGNWRAFASYQVDKKQHRKSFTAPTKKEAEYQASEWLRNRRSQPKKQITLEQAYDIYINSRNNVLSPAVIYRYRNMANNDFPSLLDWNVEDITQDVIQSEVNKLSATCSPKTVRNKHGLLVSVLKYVRPDIMIRTKLPQKIAVSIKVPSENEISELYSLVKNTDMEVPFLLASQCGLRQGEICALTKKDIQGDKIIINKSLAYDGSKWIVKQPKSYHGNRIIPCNKYIIDLMFKAGTDRICALNNINIADKWRTIMRRSNIEYFSFHKLRHYYCSQAVLQGIPKQYIVELMGHSSSRMVEQIYAHTFPEYKDKYAKTMLTLTDSLIHST